MPCAFTVLTKQVSKNYVDFVAHKKQLDEFTWCPLLLLKKIFFMQSIFNKHI